MERLSLFGNHAGARIETDPYPHLVIENALPADLYEHLEQQYPALDYVAAGGTPANNTIYLRSAHDVLADGSVDDAWLRFFEYHTSAAFYADVLTVWGTELAHNYPDLEAHFGKPAADFSVGRRLPGKRKNPANRQCDVMLDCVFGSHSPVTEVSVARGPHVDNPAKMFSALLYFRADDDDSSGGDYELYRPAGKLYPRRGYKSIDPHRVERVKSLPYRPNTVISWLNTALSIHAVAPRSITPHTRRYVAVTAECYGRGDGYFLQHDDWNTPLARLKSLLRI